MISPHQGTCVRSNIVGSPTPKRLDSATSVPPVGGSILDGNSLTHWEGFQLVWLLQTNLVVLDGLTSSLNGSLVLREIGFLGLKNSIAKASAVHEFGGRVAKRMTRSVDVDQESL